LKYLTGYNVKLLQSWTCCRST